MRNPDEDNPYRDDGVQNYVRQVWTGEYYDGDEYVPELDGIILESAGMHVVGIDEFGFEIYEENEYESYDDLFDYDEDSSDVTDEDNDFVIVDEEDYEDLEEDETYESRVISRLYDDPHAWQEEALLTWERNDHVGIVEAVTGSGKTFLGILAAAKALDDGFGVVVVVPTRVLQEQWLDDLHGYFSKDEGEASAIVGALGGEYGSDYRRTATRPIPGKIVVAVSATFSSKPFFHPAPSEPMLLIADEVHRYSGDKHSFIFQENFERRLGLTATFEPALGRYSVYENYFGESPLYSYTFKEAISDDVVSKYDVVLVRVLMPDVMQREYALLWNRMRSIEDNLRFYTNITFNPDKVHREISILKENNQHLSLVEEWEKLNETLDSLLSNKATKESTIKMLAPYIQMWGHTVVFTDYLNLAEDLHTILLINSVYSRLLNHKVAQKERSEVFKHFEEGRIRSLVSPRILDEGVNLPLLSFGIFAGVRRRRLQLVQRLGRILRKDPEKTWPLVCIPVNIGTFEDPSLPGNQLLPYSPLGEILKNASRVKVVDAEDEQGFKSIFNVYDIGEEESTTT